MQILVSRQLKAGLGIYEKIHVLLYPTIILFGRGITPQKGTLGRVFQSFLPICLCKILFKSSRNQHSFCCVKKSNKAEKWRFFCHSVLSWVCLRQTCILESHTSQLKRMSWCLPTKHVTKQSTNLSWKQAINKLPSPGCQPFVQVLSVPCLSTPPRLM